MLISAMVKSPAQETPAEAKANAAQSRNSLPAIPATGLLDNGSVFNGDDRKGAEAAVRDFAGRVGMPVYIVTENYLVDGTVDQYGDRLATGWLKGKPGVVLLYERATGRLNYSATPGSFGKDGDPRSLFVTGSKAAAALAEDASAAQRMTASVNAMAAAGETWKKTGQMPPPATPAPAPPPVPNPESIPKPPVDFVMDDADVFSLQDEVSLKTTLVKFHGKNDMDLYVLTYRGTAREQAQRKADDLAEAWLKDRFGAVLVFNTGSGDGNPMGAAGSDRNESFIPPAVLISTFESVRAKGQEVRTLPSGSEARVIREAAVMLMDTFVPHVVTAREEVSQPTTTSQWRVLTAVAAALVVGSALLFLFHRLQERLESRSREQLLFPEVTVDRRLGSPQGGGLVVSISFGERPPGSGKNRSPVPR